MAAIENGANPSPLVETPVDHANAVRFPTVIRVQALDVYVHAGNINEILSPTGESALLYAVRNNNVELVRILLRNGADVNLRDNDGNSPLLRSCIRTVITDINEIFQLLLESGADVNARNSFGWTALHLARCHSMVKELLERGADVNARDNRGRTPLDRNWARSTPSTINPIVTELLHWGAAIDKEQEGVVFLLVQDKDCSVELIRRVFQGTGYAATRDHMMRTPLHHAVRTGRAELVRELLACGASVRARDSLFHTPLHVAAAFVDCGVEVVSELIREGAEKDARNNVGRTPLHLAFQSVNESVVGLLLSAGADPDVHWIFPPSSHPCTPLLLKHSVLRHYASTVEYARGGIPCENALICAKCVSEIEDMRRTRLSEDLTLYDVALGDKWDISCARKVFESMSSGDFPMYSEMVLTKLISNIRKFLSDPATNNSLFLHALARKSGFRTNRLVLFEIVKYLSDDDCLNLYFAGC